MPFTRLIEARGIITHGLGENGAHHEAYMAEFRQMVNQLERLYPLWLIDKGKPTAAIAAEIPDTADQLIFRIQIACRVSMMLADAIHANGNKYSGALIPNMASLQDVLTMPIAQLLEEVKREPALQGEYKPAGATSPIAVQPVPQIPKEQTQ